MIYPSPAPLFQQAWETWGEALIKLTPCRVPSPDDLLSQLRAGRAGADVWTQQSEMVGAEASGSHWGLRKPLQHGPQ